MRRLTQPPEQACLEFRQGEWAAGNSGPSAFNVEQARLGRLASETLPG